ncbi:MAG TPA: hypothetical protein VF412_18525 [Bdellovibrio sp.]|uniref:hypothetical protein n=1 Tax=Bdellovibrio sp. TaxID=28201 RepID=UPI002EEE22A1
MKISALLMSLCLFLSACATNQKSRLAATAVGVGVGGIIGAATAPSDERTELHALYWAGIIGVISAVAANYYWNDERDIDMMKLENEKMKAQLDFFQSGTATLLKETTGSADKRYFQSGKAKIKLYKVDQWVDEGPNKKSHRDQMIEILPLEAH